MDRDLRLVWLSCVIEDAVRQILGEARLRSRGPTPALTDVEALTIEIFGETLGLNSDASIWRYACDHLRDWFPGLGTEWNFVRRCANVARQSKQVTQRQSAIHPMVEQCLAGKLMSSPKPPAAEARRARLYSCLPARHHNCRMQLPMDEALQRQ